MAGWRSSIAPGTSGTTEIVALKVLQPNFSAKLGAERFLREIRVAARLQHPHLLPLYDSGDAGGLLYYVMPCVEGGSLRDLLDRESRLGPRTGPAARARGGGRS